MPRTNSTLKKVKNAQGTPQKVTRDLKVKGIGACIATDALVLLQRL